MKRWLVILIMLSVSAGVSAQSLTEQEIVSLFEQSAADMQSLECRFVQTKKMKMLNDKMVSEGRMCYEKPEKLKWEYITPFVYSFTVNGNKALVRNSEGVNVVDMDKNRNFRKFTGAIMNLLTGDAIADTKAFSLSAEENDGKCIVTLVPKRNDIKQMWKHIVLHFDRTANSIVKVEINEASGDIMVIEFMDIRRNMPVGNDVFNIQTDLR